MAHSLGGMEKLNLLGLEPGTPEYILEILKIREPDKWAKVKAIVSLNKDDSPREVIVKCRTKGCMATRRVLRADIAQVDRCVTCTDKDARARRAARMRRLRRRRAQERRSQGP